MERLVSTALFKVPYQPSPGETEANSRKPQSGWSIADFESAFLLIADRKSVTLLYLDNHFIVYTSH